MNKIKVLVADDHTGFRRILATFLRSQPGVELIGEAVDGEDAVSQSERLSPDLVLLDIHMPRRDGIEAAKSIKRLNPRTIVIMMSMDSSLCYRESAQTIADGYLPKPTMKSSLLSLLAAKESAWPVRHAVEVAVA